MSKRLDQLHRERGQLIERIASQRAVLASQLVPLQKFAATGDRAVGLIDGLTRYVRQHPLPVLVAAAALVLLKPKVAWRWAKRGLFVWRSFRSWRSWRVQHNSISQAAWLRWF